MFSYLKRRNDANRGKDWGDEGGQKYGAEHQGKEAEWWRGCEDERGKLRRRLSDGAQRSERSREDESEKGKTAGKICSNESSRMQIYGLFWVSLYINQSRWGDSTKVTPLGLCVFICVCVAAHTYSPSTCSSCVLQSKQTSKLNRNESPAVRRRPPVLRFSTMYLVLLVRRRDAWTTQDRVVKALLWCGKGMCSAWLQSHRKQSPSTVLLPPVRHHYSSSLDWWDAQKDKDGEWEKGSHLLCEGERDWNTRAVWSPWGRGNLPSLTTSQLSS